MLRCARQPAAAPPVCNRASIARGAILPWRAGPAHPPPAIIPVIMSPLSAAQQADLAQILTPERVRTDARERRVCSRDTGVLPGPMRFLAGRSLADAVVQPSSEEELA